MKTHDATSISMRETSLMPEMANGSIDRPGPGKEEIMKQLRILKVMLLVGLSLLFFSGYSTAADSKDMYKGELVSGLTKAGNLGSDELWIFHGQKGSHIVISAAVDDGKTPPEIYLYPPENREYVDHSKVVSTRSQVLDYKLDADGRYTVLIHPCTAQDKTSYRIAYSVLDPGDSYTVQPNDHGNLLKVTSARDRSGRGFVDNSHGLIPASIVFDVATFGVGPIIFDAFTAVVQAIVGTQRIDDRIAMASRNLDQPPEQCSVSYARVEKDKDQSML
jgi:hypothetical protein